MNSVILNFQGIWYGMMTGTIVQTCVLFVIVYRTNWNREASIAEDRIKKWGGSTEQENDVEKTNEN
jgi:MATE family multidrug resistance protein